MAQSSVQAPFTSEIVGSILTTDSCEKSQSTLCRLDVDQVRLSRVRVAKQRDRARREAACEVQERRAPRALPRTPERQT